MRRREQPDHTESQCYQESRTALPTLWTGATKIVYSPGILSNRSGAWRRSLSVLLEQRCAEEGTAMETMLTEVERSIRGALADTEHWAQGSRSGRNATSYARITGGRRLAQDRPCDRFVPVCIQGSGTGLRKGSWTSTRTAGAIGAVTEPEGARLSALS